VSTLLTGRTPLSARQLLAVNLLTDVAPALAIAVRPPPGRSPEQLIEEGPDVSLGRSLEQAIAIRAATTAAGAAAAWVIGTLTGGPRRASTMALVALVGSQLGQTLVGGGWDPLVLAAGGGSALVLTGIVQTPGVSQLFGCTPLDPLAWLVAVGAAAGATAASAVGSWLANRAAAPVDSRPFSGPKPIALEPATRPRLPDVHPDRLRRDLDRTIDAPL
jgi:magnesium-transporting ATPase (P-type)